MVTKTYMSSGMKALRKVMPIFDHILNVMVALACLLVVIASLVVGLGAILRYSLGFMIPWSVELSEYILFAILFLGTAWVLRREGHVNIDLVLSRLNPRTQALLNVITSSLGAVACLVLVRYAAQIAWEFFQAGFHYYTELSPPKYPFFGLIAVGSFMLFVQFLRRIFGYLKRWTALRNKEQESEMQAIVNP